MTRTGTKVFACSTAIALCVAGSAVASERARGVNMAPNSSAATGSGPAATSAPTGFAEYARLMQDGGALTGGPLVTRSSSVAAKPGSRMVTTGSTNNLQQGKCDRAPLACGVYDDVALFETEQGPFSRALGNLEDWELSNVGANTLCVVGNLPADCNAHPDPSGFFCAGNSLDAGDVLKGLNFVNTPLRGGGAFDYLLLGPGFSGNASKYALPNYFGDTHDLTFPNAAVPVGCQKASPGPNVAGFHLAQPFGSQPGATLTIDLANSKTQIITTGRIEAAGTFLGLCCEAEILKISIRDNDGLSIGLDNVKWGTNVAACPVTFPPLKLEDINCAIEVIEEKLDNAGPCSGSCSICSTELEALGTNNVRNGLEAKRDAACRAKARGQDKTAENIMCAFLNHVNAQDGKGLTPAEADGLRDCAANDGDIGTANCKHQ